MVRSLPFRWQPETTTQEQVSQAMGMNIENLAYDRRIVFDQLMKIYSFSVKNCPDLEEVSCPVLEEIVADGTLTFWRNTNLKSLSLPNLRVFSPDSRVVAWQVAQCPALTTIRIPQLVTFGGQSCDFSGNALSAETVNHILGRMVADQSFHCVVDLRGGTNASPTGQGLTDKATLQARGCIIQTN